LADSTLTPAQVKVLHLFFSLGESVGFILAGGAGLVAVGLSERPTEDIDLFAPEASVPTAGNALEIAARAQGGQLSASTMSIPSAGSSYEWMMGRGRWSI